MATSSLPRLSQRLSLAPTQPKHAMPRSEEVDASLLMDMSLADLQKTRPVKGKGKRVVKESDLDKLTHEELEELAWEAVAEEKRLRLKSKAKSNSARTAVERGGERQASKLEVGQGEREANAKTAPTTPPSSGPAKRRGEEDPMKNITIRRKSNSPRKVTGEDEKREEVMAPLLRSTTIAVPIKHSYDRLASPTRSALRRPRTRKSVAFGEVAEYEISRGEGEVEAGLKSADGGKAVGERTASSSSSSSSSGAVVESSDATRSSSPLFRYSKSISTTMLEKSSPSLCDLRANAVPAAESNRSVPHPAAKKLIKASKPLVAATSTRRSSLRSGGKEEVKPACKPPSGYRLTSTGTLVAETKSNPFKAASGPAAAPRRRRSSTTEKVAIRGIKPTASSKANPVPVWLRRRKEALLKAEDEQLRKDLERVRVQELAKGGEKRGSRRSARRVAPAQVFESAVEKRMAERATWESKRRAKEELLEEEKQRAIRERQSREEAEYRLARQRSVVRANPVPDWLRARAAK